MSPPEGDAPDEFDWIASLRPLAGPEGLGLLDDAALIAVPAGQELVITKDTIVQGVHYQPATPLDQVADRLLRVNLSDLAAKGARPWGYFLSIAWPRGTSRQDQHAFAQGLMQTQTGYGLKLFGGDTVSADGPLVATATLLGLVEEGRMVRRSGAVPGDLLMVSGVIGEAWMSGWRRQPQPRLDIDLAGASACADVSDGLIADAAHIGRASGVALQIDLDRMPLSEAAKAWLAEQPDRARALTTLATSGDDYELIAAASHVLDGFTVIGRVVEGAGVAVRYLGEPVAVPRTGWRHGKDG